MTWLASWDSFVKVVEEGSMAAAARRLDCTRAQVSKQIGELEQTFGLRLFERSTRKLGLTPAGEIFLRHARLALEAIENTDIAVRNTGDTPHGLLRIGASVIFGRQSIAPLLPDLVARYPELECELILTDDPVDLAEDRIDVALRLTRAPPEEAVSRQLLVLKRVVCASPGYLAAHGTPATPQDLTQHACFSHLLRDGGVWRLADRHGKEVEVPVRSRIQFNNIGCILDATRAGHGIAILPTYLCGDDLASGALVSVLDDHEPQVDFGRNLYACYLPSRSRAAKVKQFLAQLEALLTPIPPWDRYREGR